jgi:uncharacterized protein with HEPN domain
MKDERVYLRHILRCIERIEEYTKEGRDRFFESHLIQDAVICNLQTMAESTQRLSDALKSTRPEVDWFALAGFRNVLVHDYMGVDLDYVYRAIEQDMPRLKAACTEMLNRLGKGQ